MSCRSKLIYWFLEVPLRYWVTIRDFHEWHAVTSVSSSALHCQIQEHSSQVGGGEICDCQFNIVGGCLSIRVVNVLTTVLAEQSVARTQSLVVVVKMDLASDVVVTQRCSATTDDAQRMTSCQMVPSPHFF